MTAPFELTYFDEDAQRRTGVLSMLTGAGFACRPAAAPVASPEDRVVWVFGAQDLEVALPTITLLAAHCPVVVLWAGQEPATVIAALRAGATDVVATPEALPEAVRKASGRLIQARPASARVIAVCSPKGGAGKSFLTANLAVALHRHTGLPTRVLDMSLPAGHQAMYFDLRSTVTVSDLLALQAIEPEVARQALNRHMSGVDVLAGPVLEREDALSRRDIRPLLAALGTEESLIVADMGSFLSECHVGLLAMADLIVIPVAPHIAGLASLPATLEALASLGVPSDRLIPVINESSIPGRTLPPAMLARMTGEKACWRVPWGGAAVSCSIDDGCPLTYSHPRHPVSRAINALATDLAARLAVSAARAPRQGLLQLTPWWPKKPATPATPTTPAQPNRHGGPRHVSA